MAPITSPIPLICIGRSRDLAIKLSDSFGSKFVYSAIVTDYVKQSEKSRDTILTLLETLHPRPAGLFIGSAFDAEVQAEVKAVVDEWNESHAQDAGKGNPVKFLLVPPGFMEQKGAGELEKFIKNSLAKEFGVEW